MNGHGWVSCLKTFDQLDQLAPGRLQSGEVAASFVLVLDRAVQAEEDNDSWDADRPRWPAEG